MTAIITEQLTPTLQPTLNATSTTNKLIKKRYLSEGCDASIFSDIYKDDINIVNWKRDLSESLKASVNNFLLSNPNFKKTINVSPHNAFSNIKEALGTNEQIELAENITELVEMYCYLFDLSEAGLRLTSLDKAMCPKFHVDSIPCRMVTTYQGVATQWLAHDTVNRDKLGHGSKGLDDNKSGLYESENDIQQLQCGEVALLKGEYWHNNEYAGLVHRSPIPAAGENRLLLTLDFVG